MYDKHQIREKPDMVKVTSPVLKSSGERRLSSLRQQLATDQGFFCLFSHLVNFLNIIAKAIHEPGRKVSFQRVTLESRNFIK
jgi:hypothetical protein